MSDFLSAFWFLLFTGACSLAKLILQTVSRFWATWKFDHYVLLSGWDKAIEELNNKPSSFRGSSNSAAVASTSNAAEFCQEGIKDISLTVFEGVSFSPGTKFVQLPDGSEVQVQSSANRVLCSDFGFASTALHTTAEDEQVKNVKRQRIGG
jgi:hypothetical protein